MKVGVPKEIKIEEYRVGLSPFGAHALIKAGHEVIVEHNAGLAINFFDEDYIEVGAKIVEDAQGVFALADMIVKVKEPQPSEYKLLREGQILFAYLHLAPDLTQAEGLIKSGCVAIAYETVTDDHGHLPLLFPMSQIAGRLAIQAGATCLEKPHGGCGILLGGIPGVYPGHVVVLGGGVVGVNAIGMALNKEAHVTVVDKSPKQLQALERQYAGRLNTVYSTPASVEEYVTAADLVIGAVLIPGKAAPKLVTRDLVSRMKPGAVLVDVAIDQGGCFATSRPTTHTHPTYVIDGVVHYCVANMPGAVPRTATIALNNATLPFIITLADQGYKKALLSDPHLLNGLNVAFGQVTHEGVASDLGKRFVQPLVALG